MRFFVRGIDRLFRLLQGVYEFSTSPTCLLRLRHTQVPHSLVLPDGEIPAGALVVELHMWNEHMPPFSDKGPDFAWALKVQRMSISSFRAVAAHLRGHPRIQEIKAIGGATAMLLPDIPSGGVSLMRRLGFTVFPYHNPLGKFGEFWENFYTWLLIWTFNAASTRHRSPLLLRRSEIWMSTDEFLRRYALEPILRE